MLKLYNTLTRKKEAFKSIKPGYAGFYACGPTVYWYQHIGNLRTYLFEDILKRVLIYNGFKVKHVINITDVGHLTSDADIGEDKMVKALRREGLPSTKESMLKLAEKYTAVFKQDLIKLNIIKPNVWCKATEHINEQIEMIKKIEKNNYTYLGKNSSNVYFNTSKFKNYGRLAKLKIESQTRARTEADPDKKNPRDFVLWFTTKGSKFKKHIMKWPSPWGEGWPGWHIECSAMSIHYLGEQFDIHAGGIDHIPIHHTNEIAQSEAATGKKWVNYWLHGNFLLMKKGKMAKSAGGFITLQSLIDKKYNPLIYRYLCLTAHYRTQLEFSFENLDSAKNACNRLKNLISELKDDKKTNKECLKKFEEAINNDLDMPKALSILWELIRNKKAEGKINTIKEMDKIFSLNLLKKEKFIIPKEIEKLAEQREKARKSKNWKKSDELREKIKQLGWIVEDTAKGPKLKKTN